MIVKSRCVNPVSTVAFDFFESVTWTGLPVVTDVLVMCDGASSNADWEFVEPQSFLSPQSVRLLVWRFKER